MKKHMTLSGWLVMATAFTLATTACSSDDNIVEESEPPATPEVYTMVIKASKGGEATTRALQPGTSGGKNTIDAYWSGTETFEIFQYTGSGDIFKIIGTATAAASPNAETTITATLTEAPNPWGMEIHLNGVNLDYNGQVGLLTGTAGNSISERYDYAYAILTGEDFTVDGHNIIPKSGVKLDFIARQAIVRFTLVDKRNNDAPINATCLSINDRAHNLISSYDILNRTPEYYDLTITPPSATNVIYAALYNIGNMDLTLIATVGKDKYIFTKPKVYFERGKYYEITVKMRDYGSPAYLLNETLTTPGIAVTVRYNYYDLESSCTFVSDGNGNYNFQEGDYIGNNDNYAKALLVEDGKLVFKQNKGNNLDYLDKYGYSATFNMNDNTYVEWFGSEYDSYEFYEVSSHRPYLISLELNGEQVALNKKIGFCDLVKDDGRDWETIIDHNQDKIYAKDYFMEIEQFVRRISDDAILLQNNPHYDDGNQWERVTNTYIYHWYYNYKFEGD